MNLTNQPLYRDKSFWAIIIAAIVFTGIFVLIDQKQLALGTLTGSAVGAFNYWLVYDAIRKSKSLTNSKANKLIMVRHLIRMVLAVAVLLLGMKVLYNRGADWVVLSAGHLLCRHLELA